MTVYLISIRGIFGVVVITSLLCYKITVVLQNIFHKITFLLLSCVGISMPVKSAFWSHNNVFFITSNNPLERLIDCQTDCLGSECMACTFRSRSIHWQICISTLTVLTFNNILKCKSRILNTLTTGLTLKWYFLGYCDLSDPGNDDGIKSHPTLQIRHPNLVSIANDGFGNASLRYNYNTTSYKESCLDYKLKSKSKERVFIKALRYALIHLDW